MDEVAEPSARDRAAAAQVASGKPAYFRGGPNGQAVFKHQPLGTVGCIPWFLLKPAFEWCLARLVRAPKRHRGPLYSFRGLHAPRERRDGEVP